MLVTPHDRDELASLRDAGFTAYLVKPVRATSLAARFAMTDSATFDETAPDQARSADTRPLSRNSLSAAQLSCTGSPKAQPFFGFQGPGDCDAPDTGVLQSGPAAMICLSGIVDLRVSAGPAEGQVWR